jgi:hypothetical protein
VAQATKVTRSEVERRRAAAERMRGLFADPAPGRNLVDELIADRRAEDREAEEEARRLRGEHWSAGVGTRRLCGTGSPRRREGRRARRRGDRRGEPAISIVNWAEVLSKIAERGADPAAVAAGLRKAEGPRRVFSIEPTPFGI